MIHYHHVSFGPSCCPKIHRWGAIEAAPVSFWHDSISLWVCPRFLAQQGVLAVQNSYRITQCFSPLPSVLNVTAAEQPEHLIVPPPFLCFITLPAVNVLAWQTSLAVLGVDCFWPKWDLQVSRDSPVLFAIWSLVCIACCTLHKGSLERWMSWSVLPAHIKFFQIICWRDESDRL